MLDGLQPMRRGSYPAFWPDFRETHCRSPDRRRIFGKARRATSDVRRPRSDVRRRTADVRYPEAVDSYRLPVGDVAAALATDATRGLEAADVEARLARDGPN